MPLLLPAPPSFLPDPPTPPPEHLIFPPAETSVHLCRPLGAGAGYYGDGRPVGTALIARWAGRGVGYMTGYIASHWSADRPATRRAWDVLEAASPATRQTRWQCLRHCGRLDLGEALRSVRVGRLTRGGPGNKGTYLPTAADKRGRE